MPNIYGKKSWSEMQKEDKKRRQTNPTPQEAARASKVQYTGEISGNSAKKGAKSYEWEQELLGDYKGRSYNDKYAKFAKQQGFSFTDSVEFRKFMDVQENSKKPIKTNKDGSVRANQSYNPGQGMQTLDSLYNSIISDSNKKFNANLASRQKEQQKQADLQQAKQHDVVKATNTERDGVLGFLDKTVGRASDAMINDVMSLFDKNFVKKQNENYAQIAADKLKSDNADTRKKGIEQAQMLNAQTRPAKNASEKASDFIGTGLGEAAPYMFGAYGAADKALKGVKGFQTAKPLIQDLVRGGVAGLGVGATKAGIQNLTDKNYTAKDAIDRILMESLTAGGGDAVLGAVGRNLNLKGQLDNLLKDTKSTTYTDDLMKEMVNAGNKNIGNPVNVLADAKTITPGLTDAERQSLKEGILPKVNTNTTDTILNDLTKPTNTLNKEDLEGKIGFAQMNDNATVRKPEPIQARQNQEYWQKRYEDFASHVNKNYDTNTMTKEALDEAWTHFAKYDEPVKLNDVVDLAYPKGYEPPPTPAPEVPKEPTLKDMLSGDEKINESVRQLTPQKRPEVPQAPPIDVKGKRSLNILPEQPKRLSDLDTILNSLKGTSEPTPKVAESIPPTTPKVDTTHVPLTAEQQKLFDSLTKDMPQEQKDNYRLRLSLTTFGEGAPTNPMVNVSSPKETVAPIDTIKNPVKQVANKFYQKYVNRNHGAKVAETSAIENNIAKAKAEGNNDLVSSLKTQLKEVKKSGSKLDWALQNESASSNAAYNFTDSHYKEIRKALGDKSTDKDVSDAIEWLMSKNLQWNKDAGRITDKYKLPYGWDWNRITQTANAGDVKPNYTAFAEKFQSMMQERRDLMYDYGMITDEEFKALSENPYYITLKRDKSFGKDNIDLGSTQGSNSAKRSVDNYILHDLGEGDFKSFYKNPLESVIEDNFSMFRYLSQNDTGIQLKRLSDIDTDNMFVKDISKKAAETDPNNVYTYYEKGEKKYLRLQDDLMKMIKSNDNALDMNAMNTVTSLFARLKTSSLEYQTTAIPRDLGTNYITSQAGPFEWFSEVWKAVKSKNKDAKEVGAIFQKAYDDNYGDIDPRKITKEFERQHHNVKVFDAKSKEDWKTLGSKIGKILNIPLKPAQALGQYTDELPRQVEVQMVTKKYQHPIADLEKGIATLENEIRTASKGGDFSSSTLGIDNKVKELMDMKEQLRTTKLDMRREQIYRGRDVINYSRAGGGGVAKWIRNYVIFANTTTQSKDKLVRAFIERPLQTTIKAAMTVGPFIAAEKYMHENMSDSDRKLYTKLPDYVRNANYVYVKNGNVTLLPKVQEMALITNPIEDLMRGQGLTDSARSTIKETLPYQSGTLAQGLVPDETGKRSISNVQLPSLVFSPTVDTIANQKLGFNQKPVSYGAKFKSDNPKANKWTLDIMKELFGNTPTADRTEYMTRQYGGDSGKYSLYGLDYLKDRKNTDKLDELLRNINPVQDRLLRSNSRYFKEPPQEKKKK